MRSTVLRALPALLPLLVTAACTAPEPALFVDDAALADESETEDWLAYGRTYSEQRFSPLEQINASTVADLEVDWYLDLPSDRGLVSTPLVADGILYFVGSMNRVRAVDAASGRLLWEYDPEVWRVAGERMRAGWEHNRGIGLWGDKVYLATWDGRLQAVDRATGELVWSVMTVDPELPLYITGAPKIFKGKVLIGNGGTEVHAARGYVTAYDAETGEQAWRFWIVPGNPADGFENEAMRMAAETWTGEWWKHGGGGNAWHGFTYDAELDQLYIGTGNGSPWDQKIAWHGFTYDAELDQLYIGTGNGSPWDQKIRSPEGGDNLFLTSVVALDPDTGEYLWHYQNTPGETWDFNSNMDIVLADLEIQGETRKVLMQAPKNGFFYVIDRTDGSLISAEPYSPVTWASHVDMESGRPVERSGARYEDGEEVVAPGPPGAHSWHAMSYNPETGLVYIPTTHLNTRFWQEGIDLENWASPSLPGRRRHGHPPGLGPGPAGAGLGGSPGNPLERGNADHRRRPGLPGPGGRSVQGLPRGHRCRALVRGSGARNHRPAHHLLGGWHPVLRAPGGLRWRRGRERLSGEPGLALRPADPASRGLLTGW
jgi:quinohemoprotein ethanol dehydrogenase